MKAYEIVQLEFCSPLVKAIDENGKEWFIPMVDENSMYKEYLAYTAWVEAGNAPEDFWTQNNV